jgi:hypothetical protein
METILSWKALEQDRTRPLIAPSCSDKREASSCPGAEYRPCNISFRLGNQAERKDKALFPLRTYTLLVVLAVNPGGFGQGPAVQVVLELCQPGLMAMTKVISSSDLR